MKSVLLVSLGGIFGSLARWGLSFAFDGDRAGNLAANISGVALATFFLVLMERRGITELRLLLLPGFCAGLTTFSAVTYQSLEPHDGGIQFLLTNIFASFVTIAVVMPISRTVIRNRG